MKKRKKIAFVIGKLSAGGAERVISTLSNSLISIYDIIIITTINQTPFYNLNSDIEIIACFEDSEIAPSNNFIQSLKLNYTIGKKINKITREKEIDLIIGFITQSNIYSIIASKLNHIPCIISERTNPIKARIPKIWKILRRILYPFCNIIVVQSSFVKEYYAAFIKKDKIVILPNPISSDLKPDFKVPRKNIVLSVGRLTKNKNHKIIIEAFNKINSNNWELHILGDGPEMHSLQTLTELSNNKKIRLLGNKKNIQDYYNRSKIFAFTSNYEGFPNALLEAMHFGLAVISTDCPSGPSELIKDGINGYLIPVNCPDKLAIKLENLMKEDELINSLGHLAYQSSLKYKEIEIVQLWSNLIALRVSS